MNRKNDIIFSISIFLTAIYIIFSIFTFRVGVETGLETGKPRDVNMDKLMRRILEQTLSDKKAKYFRIIE
ncbi:MAG: hypothetical protein FJ088_07975 [Deltaproteobacteria bacterium]|nr:hypothetical protein [Deltaproteobacteria bacterium]